MFSRITFGAVPFTQDERARLLLGDLCARIGAALRIIVVPHRAPSPAALATAVSAGRVQAAWLSPTLLLTSKLAPRVAPLASLVREGSATYHAALFVREDSPVKSPADLAGRRVAWVAASSAAGYLFPRIALARRGLDPRKLFASEVFLQSHGAVAAAVNERQVDVGATFVVFERGDPMRPVVRAGFREIAGAAPARIVLAAGPIPADVIVMSRMYGPRFRADLVRALQDLAEKEETRPLVRAIFGAQGFAPYSEATQATLNDMMQGARELGLM